MGAVSQEEGISPFLRTQFFPTHRERLHRQPVPSICSLSQLKCAFDCPPHDGRRQGLLHQLGALLSNLRSSLLESGQLVRRPELHLYPKRFDEVSCDDTGHRPVFRGRICWVRKGQSRLLHWQAVDPSP